MGLMEIIGALGGGINGGVAASERVAEERRRKTDDERRLAEETRRQSEFDRTNTERGATNKALFDLFDSSRQGTANENAEGLSDASGAVDAASEATQGAGGPFGDLNALGLKFAAKGVQQGADQAATEAKTKGQFDPEANYETLTTVQQKARDMRDRQTDRNTQRSIQREGQVTRNREADSRIADRAAQQGDAEAQRSALLRYAKGGKIDLTPEEIAGMSPDSLTKMMEKIVAGDVGTGDYKDRRAITINMPTPSKGSSGPDNSLTVSDMNTAVSQQGKAFDDLIAAPPGKAKEILGYRPVLSADDARERITQLAPDLIKSDPATAAWLARLQYAEGLQQNFGKRRDKLITDGTRRESDTSTPAEAPGQPAPRQPAPSAAPPSVDASALSKDQWQTVKRRAQAAVKANPNDEEAKQAVADADRALGGA